jgi:uncharacterized membrane protein YfcA
VLLAVGYTPVVANVTNTVGIVIGTFSGVAGYRREQVGQRDRIAGLALPSAGGALVGALLLLACPRRCSIGWSPRWSCARWRW